MNRKTSKFCFVVHPLSLEDLVRYEPNANGKGPAIIRTILEWMPSWAAVHVTGGPRLAQRRRQALVAHTVLGPRRPARVVGEEVVG